MKKYFTADEAKRALIFVRPVVSDILEKMARSQSLYLDITNENNRGANQGDVELLGKLQLAQKLIGEIEYHIQELEGIGVLFKDLKMGLVDFPAKLSDREIHLCWMHGEQSIIFWHETYENFSDRKPLKIPMPEQMKA